MSLAAIQGLRSGSGTDDIARRILRDVDKRFGLSLAAV
jgi:hypothetical protein